MVSIHISISPSMCPVISLSIHMCPVISLSIHSPSYPFLYSSVHSYSQFATGSCDGTAHLWQYRQCKWTSIVLVADVDRAK